jgi:hypothetical protein
MLPYAENLISSPSPFSLLLDIDYGMEMNNFARITQ